MFCYLLKKRGNWSPEIIISKIISRIQLKMYKIWRTCTSFDLHSAKYGIRLASVSTCVLKICALENKLLRIKEESEMGIETD